MVYFIKDVNSGLIKIGYSLDPSKRFKQLKASAGLNLKFLGIVKEDVEYEKELHIKFKNLRVNNEWFKCEDCLVEFINLNSDSSLENLTKEHIEKVKEKVKKGFGEYDVEPERALPEFFFKENIQETLSEGSLVFYQILLSRSKMYFLDDGGFWVGYKNNFQAILIPDFSDFYLCERNEEKITSYYRELLEKEVVKEFSLNEKEKYILLGKVFMSSVFLFIHDYITRIKTERLKIFRKLRSVEKLIFGERYGFKIY